MDGASTSSSQPTINLQFSSQMSSTSDLIIKDSSGNTLITFNPSSAGFVDDTEIRTYQGAIISHPSFELNGVYYLYLGETQLGYSGQDGPGGQDTPGTLPENGGGNSNASRTPLKNGGEENNGQYTNTCSMTKEFTLTSAATTFTGVGVYSESNSSNSDDSNTSPGISTYIGIGVASIVLLSAFIPLLRICLF